MDIDIDINTLMAFLGTATGTIGGIYASSKLTAYRIQQLEKKVDEHNKFATRMPVIEEKIAEQENDIYEIKNDVKKTNDRITNLGRRNGI